MTLEDFFTLSEMKDGLISPARVEELVSVMEKERDSLVKNVGDATRQWASVASTISATENKECLDLFVRLDGLRFFDGWLKDAQTLAKEGNDSFAEDAISALLQAIEKLEIDNERLISSGICITVKNLLNYSNARVQDRVRTLIDSWKAKNVDLTSMVVENYAFCGDPTLNNDRSNTQVAADNVSLFQSIDDNGRRSSQGPLDGTASEGGCHDDTVASPVKMECVEGDICMREVSPSDGKSDLRFSSDPKHSNSEASSQVLKSERVVGDASQCDKIESVCDRIGKVEVSSANDSVDIPSNNGATAVKEATTKSDEDKSDSNDVLGVKRITSDDPESRNEIDGTRSSESKGLDIGERCSELEKIRDKETTSPSRVNNTGSPREAKTRRKSNRKYFGNSCGFARLTTKSSKSKDMINQTNMDLEDGTVDALEVACFLAKEVEREVMGYDEQSGSSSSDETTSRSSNGQPESPDSINGEDPEINAPSNDLSTMNNVPQEPIKTQHMIDPINRDTELENQAQDMESSSQVTERSLCEFDLNQEFSSADPDHQVDDTANLVSVVVVDGEKAHSDRGTGISSSSGQRRGFLDIDLNVAEAEDDNKTIIPMSTKQNAMLPALPSGESSVGLSIERSGKRKIDLNLNQTGDDEDVMLHESKMNGKFLGVQNMRRSPSPASSSSCLQPSVKNFDLNDNPSHGSNLSNQHPFMSESSSHKTSSYVGPSDDSVISIFGVKVKMNAVVPQTPPFLNKRESEPMIDTTHLIRGGTFVGLGHAVPYGQSVYGYNGLGMGPLVSFPPGLTYGPGGPIPYMVDSRGAPVIPQLFGSAPSVPPSYGQPSFVMNMNGSSPPVANVPGSLGPNLDLNSGFAAEGVNRNPGYFKQFFGPGQGGPLGEQLRDNFGPFSSGSSAGKRKEPDSGWDFYAANYKHHQPPHL